MAPGSARLLPKRRWRGRWQWARMKSRPGTLTAGAPGRPSLSDNRGEPPSMIQIHTFESPIGPLTAAERGGRVCLLHFGADSPQIDRIFDRWYAGEPRTRQPLAGMGNVLRRYFGGELSALDGVPVELNGTPFQRKVWLALRRIPSGATISYAELARR